MLCLRCLVDASLDVVCRNVSNPSPPIFQHEARSDDTEPCVVEARQILEANDACERGPFELRRGHGILKRQRTLADRRDEDENDTPTHRRLSRTVSDPVPKQVESTSASQAFLRTHSPSAEV